MPLRPLDITDDERRVVARLHWSPPGTVTVEAITPDLKAFLEEIVHRYTLTGVPSQRGIIFEIDGHTARGTKVITLTIDDPDFINGIAERLNDEETQFQGQRLHGIIRRRKEIPEVPPAPWENGS